jgi:hypothetical protein
MQDDGPGEFSWAASSDGTRYVWLPAGREVFTDLRPAGKTLGAENGDIGELPVEVHNRLVME